MLDEKGQPTVVERAFIVPAEAQIGPVTPDERKKIISQSVLAGHYEAAVDRESAYEKIKARVAQQQAEAAPAAAQESGGGIGGMLGSIFGGGTSRRQGVGEAMVKSAVRTIGSEIGRQVIRGVLGSILGGRRK